MRKIILASSSKWRKEILTKTGLPFEIVESGFEEDMTLSLAPKKLVTLFAREKARAVAKHYPDAIVIGADTVLVFEGKILGKPKTKAEATATLKRWSGKRGVALTGLAIIDVKRKREVIRTVETKIFFRDLSGSEIAAYVQTGEPLTAAGSFTITSKGAAFVRRIEGDFYNIAGLPLADLMEELKAFGIKR